MRKYQKCDKLQGLLDDVTKEIINSGSISIWGAWAIMYVLESIDEKVDGKQYRAFLLMLRNVSVGIAKRLNLGLWFW